MNVARPPGGFRIVIEPQVASYIEAESIDNFRLPQMWIDLFERLKFTALREGTPLKSSPPTFIFVADGASDFNIPTVQVVYRCVGDTLTVSAALVWAEADRDDADQDDA